MSQLDGETWVDIAPLFRATGRVPDLKAPSSPLITLLQSLHPRERLRIASVTISGP